jgi:hypothetical protein
MPTGITGKIVRKEPAQDLRAKGFASVDRLFSTLNEVLEEEKLRVWVLLDRLDVVLRGQSGRQYLWSTCMDCHGSVHYAVIRKSDHPH